MKCELLWSATTATRTAPRAFESERAFTGKRKKYEKTN